MVWIDVTVGLHEGLVTWPGDPKVSVSRPQRLGEGAPCNVSRVDMGVHSGTHMDAPEHFIDGADTIDRMPLKATVGVAKVIEIRDPHTIDAPELAEHDLRAGDRVLFKTRNSSHDWANTAFDERFVHINADGARYLVDHGVRTVGIDYLSVGAYQGDGVETHKVLLGAGVWIIEGLDLSKVSPGLVELVCLPLKIIGADGAPCRAIIRPIDATAA